MRGDDYWVVCFTGRSPSPLSFESSEKQFESTYQPKAISGMKLETRNCVNGLLLNTGSFNDGGIILGPGHKGSRTPPIFSQTFRKASEYHLSFVERVSEGWFPQKIACPPSTDREEKKFCKEKK